LPDVYLRGRDVGAALGGSVGLTQREPGWTIQIALVGLVAGLVASAIPLLGSILVLPLWIGLHTRAFRAAYAGEVEDRPSPRGTHARHEWPEERWPRPPLET